MLHALLHAVNDGMLMLHKITLFLPFDEFRVFPRSESFICQKKRPGSVHSFRHKSLDLATLVYLFIFSQITSLTMLLRNINKIDSNCKYGNEVCCIRTFCALTRRFKRIKKKKTDYQNLNNFARWVAINCRGNCHSYWQELTFQQFQNSHEVRHASTTQHY